MQTASEILALDDVKLAAKRIFSLIAAELGQVEIEFERQAQSNVQVIAFLGDYLRASGGKRVRPALTILSNYAVGGDGSRYNSIRMATVMEFLHTATLVHDDIIDERDTRRDRPTVNALYGNETAVLMGDWLYMSAFETSLAERSLPILDILTAVTRKMTEGELLQLNLWGGPMSLSRIISMCCSGRLLTFLVPAAKWARCWAVRAKCNAKPWLTMG